MTNLKKVLSLALVFAMALGLMISGSAATWTDKDDITNFEDAALLDSLQIMQGNADGTFDPDGILTRAQIAKMIYVARTGGVDDKAVLYKGSSNLFTDVAGHWAEGYINFAAAKGFVSGRGNGIFDPDAKITGYELLKIALTALGYDAAKEGFTGANWKLSVAAMAQEAGLTTDYLADPANPVTRDNAANVIANMIFATAVRYVDGVVEARTKIVGSNTVEVLFGEAYLSLVANTGVVIANEYTNGGLKGKTTIHLTDAEGRPTYNGIVAITGTFSAPSGLDELGQIVTIYTKGTSTTRVYGGANVSSLNKVVTSYGNLSNANKTTFGSLLYWLAGNGLSVDYAVTTPKYITKGIAAAEDNTAFDANKRGEFLKVIDNNGDGYVDYMIKIQKTVATVATKGTSGDGSITFTAVAPGTSFSGTSKTVDTFADLAASDVVLAYEYGGVYRVEKASSITGKMTASAVVGTTSNATIEGSTYYGSELVNMIDNSSTTFASWTADTGNFQKSNVFYLDNGNNVIKIKAVETTISNDMYLYVLDSEKSDSSFNTTYQVKALYADGSIGIATVAKVSGAKPSFLTNSLNTKVYSYTKNEDGSLNLIAEATTDTLAASPIKPNVAQIGQTAAYANASTIYITYTNLPTYEGATKYTGIANAPTLTANTGVVVIDPVTKVAKVAFIMTSSGAATAPKYVYITGGNSMSYDPATTAVSYTYPVVLNGAKDSMTVNGGTSGALVNNNLQTGLYTYTVSGGVFYTFTSAGAAANLDQKSDGFVRMGSTVYAVSSSTVAYIINGYTGDVTTGTADDLIASETTTIGDDIIVVPNIYNASLADYIYTVRY